MEQVAQRTGLGQFAPGASGNAGGRPRKTDAVREAETLAREASPATIRKLIAMRDNRNGKVSESGVLRAAELILAYGLGKPAQRDVGERAENFTFLVQTLTVPAGPVAGVLSSPIDSHVWRQSERTVPLDAATGATA